MHVVYDGSADAVELPVLNVVVRRGESIEVPDEVGASLIEQSTTWNTSPEEVLAWVGDDRDRAKRLLVAERDGAERADVLTTLQAIVSPPPVEPTETPSRRRAAEKKTADQKEES